MILRPLEPPPAAGREFLPAWNVVERMQRQAGQFKDGCWMITQPSHAALAGEFAAKIITAKLPRLDAAMVRGIALHDAGWGIPDAQAIMQSRSAGQGSPRSFVDCSANEFLYAWEKSIDVAASTGPESGYIVSRHFCRLAGQSMAHHGSGNADQTKLLRFMQDESRRQAELAARQQRSHAELETLTDVLQFCDLLSLYVCSGAQENAEFPEYFGVMARLTVKDETYRLDPAVLEPGAEFQVAALRHPASAGVSGQQIKIVFPAS
jgi:hypothetical protein